MGLIHNSKLEITKLRYKGHGRYLEYTEVWLMFAAISNCKVNLSYYRLPLQTKSFYWIDSSTRPFDLPSKR